MKMPKKKIQKWIDSLRSGEFQQTKYRLQDENGFCCLGVLCKTQGRNYLTDGYGYLIGGGPRTIYGAPAWVARIDGDFSARTGGLLLSTLNDEGDFTFEEIADLLQAVYIEEVL